MFCTYQVDTNNNTIKPLRVLGKGSRNIVVTTSDPSIISRLCFSVMWENPISIPYGEIHYALSKSTEPFLSLMSDVLSEYKGLHETFTLLPYSHVKDEFIKAMEFFETPNLHLGVASTIQRFDFFSTNLTDMRPNGSTCQIVVTVQFNRKMSGDISKRLVTDWKPIDIINLLYGYFQSQHAVLIRTGHYHTDCHPENILYEGEFPVHFFINDFGFTSGFEVDNSRIAIHNGSRLHRAYLSGSDKVFTLLDNVAAHNNFFAIGAVVAEVWVEHKASIDLPARDYFNRMMTFIQEVFVTKLPEELLNEITKQLPTSFITSYFMDRLRIQDAKLKA